MMSASMNRTVSAGQICFSRLGGTEAGSGWQTFNVTPQVNADDVHAFELMQGGNGNFDKFDPEDQRTKTVTELRVTENRVFLNRIKYGLVDETHRPKFFSHGFVFPLEDYVSDPQSVLDVEWRNFAFDEPSTAAGAEDAPQLSRVPARSLPQLLAACALDARKYANLLKAIAVSMVGTGSVPLNIVCDCSEDTVRALAACVAMGLPPSLRRRLTWSTYVTNAVKPTSIVFAHPSREVNEYFDVTTGRMYRRGNGSPEDITDTYLGSGNESHAFLDDIARLASDDQARAAYCAQLDRQVYALAGSSASRLEVYDIAAGILLGGEAGRFGPSASHTVEQCNNRLFDMLRVLAKVPDECREYRDELTADVLEEMLAHGYEVRAIYINSITPQLETTSSQRLREAGHRCVVAKERSEAVEALAKLETPEAGAQWLIGNSRGSADEHERSLYAASDPDWFANIRPALLADDRGCQTLAAYYALLGRRMLDDGAVKSRDDIIAFLRQCAGLRVGTPELTAVVRDMCARVDIEPLTDCRAVTMRWLDDVDAFWRHMFPSALGVVDDLGTRLCKRYWACFPFEKWDCTLDDVSMRLVADDVPLSLVALSASTVAEAFGQVDGQELISLIDEFIELCSLIGENAGSTADAEASAGSDGVHSGVSGSPDAPDEQLQAAIASVERSLIDACFAKQRELQCYKPDNIDIWLRVAAIDPKTNIALFLADRHVDGIAPEHADEAAHALWNKRVGLQIDGKQREAGAEEYRKLLDELRHSISRKHPQTAALKPFVKAMAHVVSEQRKADRHHAREILAVAGNAAHAVGDVVGGAVGGALGRVFHGRSERADASRSGEVGENGAAGEGAVGADAVPGGTGSVGAVNGIDGTVEVGGAASGMANATTNSADTPSRSGRRKKGRRK